VNRNLEPGTAILEVMEMVVIKNDLNEKHIPIAMEDLKQLLEMVNSISYGSITLLIQDRRVIQIEKNEKVRLK
jgi:hypothetical protein